ncbi:hypothetical protein GWK47_012017 [Chionoecetes opilio]|uniref:Uncharacterized protein n=1 Tax=Chionoecetes opilio TaxID=41210 RepID=A0A8J5CPL6_CHIOP|nr:hypothetical protein GWK47_012017 [Chionoecetes opilio]
MRPAASPSPEVFGTWQAVRAATTVYSTARGSPAAAPPVTTRSFCLLHTLTAESTFLSGGCEVSRPISTALWARVAARGSKCRAHHSVTEGQPGPVLMCASYNLEEEEAQVCPEYRDDLCAVRSDDLDKTLLSRPTVGPSYARLARVLGMHETCADTNDLADDDLMELLGLTPHQCRD